MKKVVKVLLWPILKYSEIMARSYEKLFKDSRNLPYWM